MKDVGRVVSKLVGLQTAAHVVRRPRVRCRAPGCGRDDAGGRRSCVMVPRHAVLVGVMSDAGERADRVGARPG